jgi:hypothetical protein
VLGWFLFWNDLQGCPIVSVCQFLPDSAHPKSPNGLSSPPCWGRFLMTRCPQDPFVREKFTRERTAARKLAAEYFQRFPKERYQTEVESWRHLQSQNIEFTMKRLREPIEGGGWI